MKITKINSGAYTINLFTPNGKRVQISIRHTDATKRHWEIDSPELYKLVQKCPNLLKKFPNGFGIFDKKTHAKKCIDDLVQDVWINLLIEITGENT
tara:strand:- start:884 stop:1171 length:288 start_codon:yes stop_codon:yes gene_type:complete